MLNTGAAFADNTLQLASLDSAETLDSYTAQPLLTVARSEETQLVSEPYGTLPEPVMPTPLATFDPSYEMFPPLEKGRTLKLRDTFEKGMPSHRNGGAWPRMPTGEPIPRDTSAPGCMDVTRACTNSGQASPTQIEGNTEGLVHGSKPATNGDGNRVKQSDPNVEDVTRKGVGPSPNAAGANQPNNTEANGGSTYKPKTMADVLRASQAPNGPHVFVLEKLNNIGYATTSNGMPAIYFSGSEFRS